MVVLLVSSITVFALPSASAASPARPAVSFRRGLPNSNGSISVNQAMVNALPWNTSSPYVPSFAMLSGGAPNSASDPQTPCTTYDGGGYGSPNCGQYYQGSYGYYLCTGSNCSNHYDNSNIPGSLYLVKASVAFKGTNPSSALTSGNWISGGLSVTQPTTVSSVGGMDLSYSFYTYLTNTGTVGLAWYVLLVCEFPNLPLGECSPPSGTAGCTTNLINTVYCVLDSNSATLPANYATDTVDLTLYWCTTTACKNWNNNGVGVFIFDWHDANYSPYTWTIEDFVPPTFASKVFYFGAAYVYPFNTPDSDSFGYQMGVASSQSPLSNTNWNVQITKPGYSANNKGVITAYSVQHAQTIGAYQEYNTFWPTGGDAFWHDNWAYGGTSPMANHMTLVESAPIDDLFASQANGQSFTSISGRTVCASVTNFNNLKSLADGVGEGSWALGTFIAAHPIDDTLGYWTILSNGACSSNPATWVYASGALVSDNTVLW